MRNPVLHPIGTPPLPLPIPPARRFRAPVAAALAERARSLALALTALDDQVDAVAGLAALLVEALANGNKVLIAGNGGSAAESQHFATELVGRFRRERAALPVLALTADSAILTAVANDYGWEEVFARQVCAHGAPGDVLVLWSTSGESENLVRAAYAAREQGLSVAAITGGRPCRLVDLADLAIRAPSTDTPLGQELHVVLLHLLCELVEAELARSPRTMPR